jgi:hypothetical protein
MQTIIKPFEFEQNYLLMTIYDNANRQNKDVYSISTNVMEVATQLLLDAQEISLLVEALCEKKLLEFDSFNVKITKKGLLYLQKNIQYTCPNPFFAIKKGSKSIDDDWKIEDKGIKWNKCFGIIGNRDGSSKRYSSVIKTTRNYYDDEFIYKLNRSNDTYESAAYLNSHFQHYINVYKGESIDFVNHIKYEILNKITKPNIKLLVNDWIESAQKSKTERDKTTITNIIGNNNRVIADNTDTTINQ